MNEASSGPEKENSCPINVLRNRAVNPVASYVVLRQPYVSARFAYVASAPMRCEAL
jgi:hypothetical protein